MIFGCPSRNTCAPDSDMRFSASIARSALYSWTNPITAFRITITMMTIVSSRPPTKPDMTAAAINTMIMKSLNWSSSMRQGGRARFSCNLFEPYCASRAAAWPELKPESVLVSRRCAASSTDSVCQLASLMRMFENHP